MYMHNMRDKEEKDEEELAGMKKKRFRIPGRCWGNLLLTGTLLFFITAMAAFTKNKPGEELVAAEGISEPSDQIQDVMATSAGAGSEVAESGGEMTAETEGEEGENSFINILEADSSDLTITWEGLTGEDLSVTEAIEAEILTAIDAFSTEGYSTGFLLYDLNTGGGISYHADEVYYSASAVKGPYVAWIVQAYPEAADALYSTIENTIQWSGNETYETLLALYGCTEFNNWASDIGCQNIAITGEWYPSINAREFTMLWNSVYEYFISESCNTDIREFYNGTLLSAIYETLGEQYTVYSKAGWIGEGQGTYYNVQNDAGIVMKGENPYVIVVLSDAYGRLDLLDSLVAALDAAHTDLIT